MILPLNIEGTIYILKDDQGRTIGSGTRDVCEVLLHMLQQELTRPSAEEMLDRAYRENRKPHVNIRSAMKI
jgi:hypothetical protein